MPTFPKTRVMNHEFRIKGFLTVLFLFIILNSIFITPAYAVEKGVQVPSEKPIRQLTNFSIKFDWIKFQYSWADANSQPIDTWVDSARSAGYKVLVSVAKKPRNVPTGEEGYRQYGEFMQNLSARLGNKVEAYEIWNEPNLNDEWSAWGAIDPGEYLQLLKYGARGVKTGNPNAKVITAALAPLSGDYDDIRFFNEFVSLGGLNIPQVDAIGWHSNVTSNIPPTDTSSEGFQRVKTALDHGKPVWITEYGWQRDRASINSATQLDYINKAFEVGDSLGVATMIVWNFGFGSENPDPSFRQWDISQQTLVNSQQLVDNSRQTVDISQTNDPDTICTKSSHECAIINQNKLLLPTQVESGIKPVEKSLFARITDAIIASLFGFQIISKESLAPRVEAQHRATLPEQVKAQEGSLLEKTAINIGSKTNGSEGVGIYPKEIAPQAQEGLSSSCDFEKLYEQSYFPSGININPITKSGCKAI